MLLASLARLENCCHECLNTFNEINNLLSIKPNEYEDFCQSSQHIDSLAHQLETTSFMNTTTSTTYQREKLKQTYLNEIMMRNENEDNDLTSSAMTNNFLSSAFVDEKKKLYRNNSFRAAIGELPTVKCAGSLSAKPTDAVIMESTANDIEDSYENDDLFKMPVPKRLLTRSVTNSINPYEFKMSGKFLDDNSNNSNTISSGSHILSSSISSAILPSSNTTKNSNTSNSDQDAFKFKLPFNPVQPSPCAQMQSTLMTKSFSMNFSQSDNLPIDRCNTGGSIGDLSRNEATRKRKVEYFFLI
jgi:hypothetical protein